MEIQVQKLKGRPTPLSGHVSMEESHVMNQIRGLSVNPTFVRGEDF